MGMKIYCCVYYQDMMTDEISKIKYIFQIKHKNVICSLLDVSEIKYYFNVIPGKKNQIAVEIPFAVPQYVV